MTKKTVSPASLSFHSRLERISQEANYFALSVPLKITQALGTTGPVPVTAQINHSEPFLISLFPVGSGRHYLRVKAEIRTETKIKEGDRVRVLITPRDLSKELSLPRDLASALRAEKLLEDFKSLPTGKKAFMLRQIENAAKSETRQKRISSAVEAVRERKRRSLEFRS
jgi:hypothetical protein